MRYLVGIVLTAAIASFAFAQPDYFVTADMVRSAQGAMGPVCVPNSVFHPGERIIFRAIVFDAETGEEMKFEDVQERGIEATVHIEGHDDIAMFYPPPAAEGAEGEGPPPGADYFRGPFPIAIGTPEGMYGWHITVTDAEGNTAEFQPIGGAIGLNSITIQAAQ